MGEKYVYKTVNGIEYKIGKFSAQTGAFVLAKTLGILGPSLAELAKGLGTKQVEKPEDVLKDTNVIQSLLDGINVQAFFAPFAALNEDDFLYLEKKCLSVCYRELRSGDVPVMHANGQLSVPELEDDHLAIMALMAHALIHNFAGFFSASLSSASKSDSQDTNSQN